MSDENHNLKPLCERWCQQYMTQAKFYIETKQGRRTLVVQYEEGAYRDLREFKSSIPDDWTTEDVLRLIESPGSQMYPAWEIPARVHGSPVLMRPKA